ncbi:MAG: alpha/beta fold hydrolase [Brevundimonas sp.]
MSGRQAAAGEGHAEVAGGRIRYLDRGEGSPVLLVHGAFGSAANFLDNAFSRQLAPGRRLIAPDSLAHGASSAPQDPACYGARARADHLKAVLDRLGIERAHVVGYSMGGWMASALATFHPERVASLAIGGWDVANGMYTPAAAWGLPEITYEILRDMVARERPDLVSWVTPEGEPGLAAAVNAMNDLAGLAEGVARCPAPVALWIGRDDLYHDAGRRFAEANRLSFISLPGDHMSVLDQHGVEAAGRVDAFIRKAAAPGVAPAVNRTGR